MKIKNFKDFKGSRKPFYLSRSSKNSIDSFNGIHLCTDSILEESESSRIETIKKYAKNIFKAFKNEAEETGDMIQIFNRKLRSKLNLKNRDGDPSPEEMAAARADTRGGGNIVNQRLNTIVPESSRVVGGQYTPGAPNGGRWSEGGDKANGLVPGNSGV